MLSIAITIVTVLRGLDDRLTGRSLRLNHHTDTMLEQYHYRLQLLYRLEKQGMLERPLGRIQASMPLSLGNRKIESHYRQ